MARSINIRIHGDLVEILDKIIDIEKDRGRELTSYADASKILVNRIRDAGGLKE